MLKRLSLIKISSVFGIAISVLVASLIGLFIFTGKENVAAFSVSDFNAGRIIDDSVFYNKDTMSAEQIQTFLDRLIPNCDIWGTAKSEFGGGTRAQYAASKGWQSPPYTCINKYYEDPNTGETSYEKGGGAFAGGLSAAQIIYNSAQKYDINPQVLLVLLKKESAGPLTSDSWPLKSQYKYAMGYACPDSGPGYSANCDSSKAGLFKQVELAAWQLNYYKEHSNDYRYKIGWNDIQYSPTPSCGTKRVYIENLATLSLYIYTPYTPNNATLANYPGEATCGAYGNRNFFMFFSEWFGSPSKPAATECDSKVSDVSCVWSIRKSDESQFLTTSKAELTNTMYAYGWINEGIAFYASNTAKPNTVPTYRLQKNGRHFYTVDQSEYNTMKTSGGWNDEGIAFYALPAASNNTSHKTYRLYNTSTDRYYWTTDTTKRNYLKTVGYSTEVNTFNLFSGAVTVPTTTTGLNNIYQLKSNATYFYTSSLTEVDTVVRSGYVYEKVLATSGSTNSGTPIYRLRYNGNKYFYTASSAERDAAVRSYNMSDEGIGFYIDTNSVPVYRLANTQTNSYFYTSEFNVAMTYSNKDGWVYEGSLISNNTAILPVYRFLNLLNNRHFYTISSDEAAKIANKGWQYETIAFYANRGVGQPVYRLLSYDKHFYTTNTNERDIAVNKYGYIDEGLAFYTSPTTTSKPAYRLQGGNDEYFYTASSQERDNAVNKYRYRYEGEGFYLPE